MPVVVNAGDKGEGTRRTHATAAAAPAHSQNRSRNVRFTSFARTGARATMPALPKRFPATCHMSHHAPHNNRHAGHGEPVVLAGHGEPVVVNATVNAGGADCR